MAQKKISRKEVMPPAYPQVELLSDVAQYKIICRHCQEKVDIEVLLFDAGINLRECKPTSPLKIPCKCGNIFKVVWDGN
jgi:hypothetical protein